MISAPQIIEHLDAAKSELVTLRWLLVNVPDSNEIVAFKREVTALQLRLMQLIGDIARTMPATDEETKEWVEVKYDD